MTWRPMLPSLRVMAVTAALGASFTAPAVPASPVSTTFGAGGGYDHNIAHAPPEEAPLGAPYYEFWGVAGWSPLTTLDHELFLDGVGEWVGFPTAPELSSGRVGLAAGWMYFAGSRWLVRVTPSVGYRFLVDRARNGLDYGGNASARLRIFQWLGLRLSGGVTVRDAQDPIYAYWVWRSRLEVEFRLWKGARLATGYAVDFSNDLGLEPTGYQPVLLDRWTVPFTADRAGEGLRVTFSQELAGRFFLSATYAYTVASSSAVIYPLHSFSGGAGFRL